MKTKSAVVDVVMIILVSACGIALALICLRGIAGGNEAMDDLSTLRQRVLILERMHGIHMPETVKVEPHPTMHGDGK